MANLKITLENHIAVVTLDRPPVNALDPATLTEITETFTHIADNRDVRVVIFTGAGARAFCAGIDLRAVDTRGEPPPHLLLDRGRAFRDACWAVYDCPLPVIGAINGPAIGAGLALAAVCDVLIASDNATFGTTEILVGLLGAANHLKMLVGRYLGRELFFTGELVPAQRLEKTGAVREVVALDKLLPAARTLAERFADRSPIAMRLAKESMNRTEFLGLKEAYRLEQDYTARLLGFEDSREARSAYLEKRKPSWKWR